MEVLTDKFSYIPESKTFVAEVSDLKPNFFSQGNWKSKIKLTNPKTGDHRWFDWKDFDMNGDEVAGARYKSVDGINLLLIND